MTAFLHRDVAVRRAVDLSVLDKADAEIQEEME